MEEAIPDEDFTYLTLTIGDSDYLLLGGSLLCDLYHYVMRFEPRESKICKRNLSIPNLILGIDTYFEAELPLRKIILLIGTEDLIRMPSGIGDVARNMASLKGIWNVLINMLYKYEFDRVVFIPTPIISSIAERPDFRIIWKEVNEFATNRINSGLLDKTKAENIFVLNVNDLF